MTTIGAVVAVNCDETNIWHCLKGIYDFCDKLVVVYSDTSWIGGKQEDETLQIIEQFEDPDDKLIIVKGSFTTQPEQRSVGLGILKELGHEFVFIVDSDELYDPEVIAKARPYLEKSDAYGFRVCFYQMWKSLQFKLVPDNNILVFHRITDDLRFVGPSRQSKYADPKKTTAIEVIPDIFCYHLTCCCSDEYMQEKLATRTYRKLVVPNWYEEKWLKWWPGMKDLHPTSPHRYERAIPFEGQLPNFMRSHKFYG